MSNENLKHIIAKLLQDAQRFQELEPNAGTAARIEEAKAALASVVATHLVSTPYLLTLAEAGYTYRVELDGSLVVKDPVRCSSGNKVWTEHKDVTVRSNNEVILFILKRS